MFKCEVCSLSVNSQEQLLQHLGGKSHKKKVKAAAQVDDNIGAVQAAGNNGEVGQETSNNVSGKKRKSSGDSEAGMCSLCSIVFNSAVQAQQHYSGNKHFKKMKVVQEEKETILETSDKPGKGSTGMLFCGFCKIQVNSMEQLEKHKKGSKHKKNFDKMKLVPVTYPGQTYKETSDPKTVTADVVPKTLPSFESYLASSFVKAESTESNMPSLDSYLKG